jgi:acetyl-CoA carboxylase biotin carboxyl carrier protein
MAIRQRCPSISFLAIDTDRVTDGSGRLELDQPTIHALLEAFDKSDWLEMTVSIGSDRLYVSRRARGERATEPTSSAAEPVIPEPSVTEVVHALPAHTTTQPLTGTVVESPSVGLFWRSPAPGAPPFVEAGTHVAAGDTLAIVEVMKLMNHVVAAAPGTVQAVLAENGARVEYGQPLFTFDPDG